MFSNTVRMIHSSMDETIRVQSTAAPYLRNAYGLVPQEITYQAEVWMSKYDEVEELKGDELAYQGATLIRDLTNDTYMSMIFFLAWGYEATLNSSLELTPTEVVTISVRRDALEEHFQPVFRRMEQFMENEDQFLKNWSRNAFVKSVEFFDERAAEMRKRFERPNASLGSFGRTRMTQAFEITCMEMYSIGLRLGPAMRDLETLNAISGVEHS